MAGLGRKVFTRETLSSSDVNGYLMDQATMRFASSAARAAAIPAPAEGMVSYLDDVNRVEVYTGAAWKIAASWDDRVWPYTRSSGNSSDTFTANTFTSLVSGTVPGAPAGDYLITWRAVLGSTALSAGFQQITVNDVVIGSGSPRADIIVVGARHVLVQTAGYAHAGGAMVVKGLASIVTGTPSVHTAGTELMVALVGYK